MAASSEYEPWILLWAAAYMLDLPTRSCLSSSSLTGLPKGTEVQVLVVQGPVPLMTPSAVTLCFLCPLILYTLGKLAAVDESAGIHLISCKRSQILMDAWMSKQCDWQQLKVSEQMHCHGPVFGVGCAVVIKLEESEKHTSCL